MREAPMASTPRIGTRRPAHKKAQKSCVRCTQTESRPYWRRGTATPHGPKREGAIMRVLAACCLAGLVLTASGAEAHENYESWSVLRRTFPLDLRRQHRDQGLRSGHHR